VPQEPQRRQGRRRVHQPGLPPRVQLHARVQGRLPQPALHVDQEGRALKAPPASFVFRSSGRNGKWAEIPAGKKAKRRARMREWC